MPKFTVDLKRSVEFTGEIEVSAKDEDAARAKAEKIIADEKLGVLVDDPLTNSKAEMLTDWSLDSDLIDIEHIDEAD